MKKKNIIYTIGHSTRPLDEFINLLKEHKIKELIDIRTIAKSRHNPQFNEDGLRHALHNKHIGYRHMKILGGLRRAKKDSINAGWRNASFRGYADYMQTDEFQEGLQKLIEIAHEKTTAIMCAEAVPWRCHRSLIGDALLVHGFEVIDIISENSVRSHELTSFAKVKGKKITYPG
jgi:uncharacterized protein (DUF488 family)